MKTVPHTNRVVLSRMRMRKNLACLLEQIEYRPGVFVTLDVDRLSAVRRKNGQCDIGKGRWRRLIGNGTSG